MWTHSLFGAIKHVCPIFFCCWLGHRKMSFYNLTSHEQSREVVYFLLPYSMICLWPCHFKSNGRSEYRSPERLPNLPNKMRFIMNRLNVAEIKHTDWVLQVTWLFPPNQSALFQHSITKACLWHWVRYANSRRSWALTKWPQSRIAFLSKSYVGNYLDVIYNET